MPVSSGERQHLLEVLGAQGRDDGSSRQVELKAANDYLARLVSYSLSSLTSEPSRINDEASFVERELTGLCAREHKIFIDVHACSASVTNALDDFTSSLDDLFDAIPDLEDECLAFAKSTQGIQRDRERAALILDQEDKLGDLLDLPQLADTCVRNGYYQEAMELSDHVRQVVERYPDLPIVRSVARTVDAVMEGQLSQLINLLREPIKLPVMAKTVGFLRRMGRMPEEELRIVFLESRVDYMRNAVDAIQSDKGDKIRYLRRYIDLFREVVYETVSQYNSIFMDTRTVSLSSAQSSQALDLVARYIQFNVARLSAIIDTSLSAIPDSSSLSSLLTQLGYSTMSFARLGMDFTALSRNPFEKAVENLVTTGWQLTTEDLTGKFQEATRLHSPPGVWLCGEESRQTIMGNPHSPPERPIITSRTNPPTYLSSFPPLAIYLNNGLSILNSLRLLAPMRTRSVASAALVKSLDGIASSFLLYATSMLDAPLLPATKRPDSMRRNTSISNQGQLREQEQAKTKEARRILVAAADALQGVLSPFLLVALSEVVYASPSEPNGKSSSILSMGSISKLNDWVQANRENLPAISAAQQMPGGPETISEQESNGSDGTGRPAPEISDNTILPAIEEAPSTKITTAKETVSARPASGGIELPEPSEVINEPTIPPSWSGIGAGEQTMPSDSISSEAALPSGEEQAQETSPHQESETQPLVPR